MVCRQIGALASSVGKVSGYEMKVLGLKLALDTKWWGWRPLLKEQWTWILHPNSMQIKQNEIVYYC